MNQNEFPLLFVPILESNLRGLTFKPKKKREEKGHFDAKQSRRYHPTSFMGPKTFRFCQFPLFFSFANKCEFFNKFECEKFKEEFAIMTSFG